MPIHAASRCILVAFALSFATFSTPAAQHRHATWDVSVLPDRAAFGPQAEYVPRATAGPDVLVVRKGATFTLPKAAAYEQIENFGTIRCSREYDTTLSVTTWIDMPGATFDCGTPADPVLRRVEIVFTARPLDTSVDPYQWSHGRVNFGTERIHGMPKTTWTTLSEDAPAGATTIAVDDAGGWAVGDEVVVADMRQSGAHQPAFRRIGSISGNAITIEAPLAIGHAAIRDYDGKVVVKPYVGNLTRNVVFRMQQPIGEGVHAHTASIGPAASSDVRYAAYVNLGRTRPVRIDSTALPHIGTNQIGKYADHLHHTRSGAVRVGNSYYGDRASKWGVAVHDTTDARVEENVCTNFSGACFVSEDGSEHRTIWRRNLALYVFGANNRTVHPLNVQANNPGTEDAGFWIAGLTSSVFDSNVAVNARRGVMLIGRNAGGDRGVPASVRGNVAAANLEMGLELWDVALFDTVDLVAAYNGHTAFGRDFTAQVWPAGIGVYSRFVNPVLLSSLQMTPRGAVGAVAKCVESSSYTPGIEVVGGVMAGCQVGIDTIGHYVRVIGTRMQNITNLDLSWVPQQDVLIQDVRHVALPGQGQVKLVFGPPPGTPPNYAHRRTRAWSRQSGSHARIVNWDGSGQDYTLFEADQRRSADASAWGARGFSMDTLLPVSGLTMGQAWDQFGMALWGTAVPDAEAIKLPDIVNGFVRTGLTPPALGPPREVLTYPNLLSPTRVEERWGNKYVPFHLTRTGDPTGTTARTCLAINDGKVTCLPITPGGFVGDEFTRVMLVDVRQLQPGVNGVRTWRERKDGELVSAMNFRFCLGAGGCAATAEGR